MSFNKRKRIIVIGFDGASWDFLDPWIAEGSLPTFRYLIQNGVKGCLESTIPPVTFPAWRCYSSGKNPGKLGVYGFTKFYPNALRVRVCNSTYFKSRDVWDYLGRAGLKVAIIDMPGTYPPKKVNGIMVSETPFPTNDYVYPTEFRKTLKKINYKDFYEFEQLFLIAKRGKILKDILEVIKSRFRLLNVLLEDSSYSFIHLTIFPTDAIAHYLWNSEESLEIWKVIDMELKSIIQKINISNKKAKNYLFIISDHGMRLYKETFYLNTWLWKKGYLVLKKRKTFKLICNHLFKMIVINILKAFPHLSPYLKKILANSNILRTIGSLIFSPIEVISQNIDKRSKAIATSGGIYIINEKDKNLRKKLAIEIAEKLRHFKGRYGKVMRCVYLKEDIYKGPYLNEAPDVVYVASNEYDIKYSLSFKIFGGKHRWIATHKPEGIFIAYGYNIKKGVILSPKIKIYDIAPTILHIFGVPIPKDMDGRVLKEIIEEKSDIFKRKKS